VSGDVEIADGVATFRHGGALVARYHFGPDTARPHLRPLLASGGTRVTRDPDEVSDHPHHQGVWIGHRDVDGVDHWTGFPGHGRIVHRGFEPSDDAALAERLTWVRPDGTPQLDELRTLRLLHDHALDVEVRLRAEHGPVTLGDDKDAAMLAVRVAPTMQGDRGGEIVLAGGRRGEAECWGAAAAWADYAGPAPGGGTAGVAVLDHPGNPRHPTRWHVRDYGLMCANPCGSRCFGEAADGTLGIAAGDELRFRFRVLAHLGDAETAAIASAYAAFAGAEVAG
jgi:Methane oxygenase PmoA